MDKNFEDEFKAIASELEGTFDPSVGEDIKAANVAKLARDAMYAQSVVLAMGQIATLMDAIENILKHPDIEAFSKAGSEGIIQCFNNYDAEMIRVANAEIQEAIRRYMGPDAPG